jgi:hypothetical protein
LRTVAGDPPASFVIVAVVNVVPWRRPRTCSATSSRRTRLDRPDGAEEPDRAAGRERDDREVRGVPDSRPASAGTPFHALGEEGVRRDTVALGPLAGGGDEGRLEPGTAIGETLAFATELDPLERIALRRDARVDLRGVGGLAVGVLAPPQVGADGVLGVGGHSSSRSR